MTKIVYLFDSNQTQIEGLVDSNEIQSNLNLPFDSIRAVYGFVSYLLSSAALAAYLVWLLLPQEYLEATGLAEVFPQKYWAVAIPIYLGVGAIHYNTL